jgi:hypothetical protein
MVKSEAFEEYALEYDQWFENHKVEYALELKAIRKLLPGGGGGNRCGDGSVCSASGYFTRDRTI